MKLLAATLAYIHAQPAVTCNGNDGAVVMKAVVPKADVQKDLAGVDGWSLKGNNYEATWSSFDGAGFTVTEAERVFSGKKSNALVISKKVASGGCTKKKVDNVEVCIETGHTLDFECAYSLDNQDLVNAKDFTVSGSDTEKSAKNVGKLNYKLEVNSGMTIGDTAAATITPKTPGLVVATVNSCSVSHDDDKDGTPSVVKLFESNTVPATNPLSVTIGTGSGDATLKFGWSSFKWTTTKKDGADVLETQKLSCEIGLSLPAKDSWSVNAGHYCSSSLYEATKYKTDFSDHESSGFDLLSRCKEECDNFTTFKCSAIDINHTNFNYCDFYTAENCEKANDVPYASNTIYRKN